MYMSSLPRWDFFWCRALLGLAIMLCVGCVPKRLDYYPTPPAAESRIYPSVKTEPPCQCSTRYLSTNRFKRVLIVVLENKNYAEVIKNPYFRDLAQSGAHFTNFHGLVLPSYSNYMAMIAGTEVESHHDVQQTYDICSIGDLLSAKETNLRWKNYAEGYPGTTTCFLEDRFVEAFVDDQKIDGQKTAYHYARKHVPFLSLASVQKNDCRNVVNAREFERDRLAGTLPEFALFTPDMDNDAHDTDIPTAAKWLQGFLGPLQKDKAFWQETLTIVTFDESDTDDSPDGPNHIYTVFLGDMVKKSGADKGIAGNYNHYNVLRTIEENFGLCSLGSGDGGARPIDNIWR